MQLLRHEQSKRFNTKFDIMKMPEQTEWQKLYTPDILCYVRSIMSNDSLKSSCRHEIKCAIIFC